MNPILTVAKYLSDNAKPLAIEIVNDIIRRFKFEVPKEEVEQGVIVYTEFLGFLGESITCKDERVHEGLIEWSKKNGEREASLKGKISSIIVRYPDTRVVFTEYITNISIKHSLSTEEVVFINKRVNYMIDISINETIFAFERHTNKIIQQAREEMHQLSAPIVPIQAGIAVLPLIGSIDSERMEYFLQKVIPKVDRLKVEFLIIDFSGIVMIDNVVANHLFEIYNILRLLGINVIATGIRPDLTQTVINNGIDFSSIQTYATVKQAIEGLK